MQLSILCTEVIDGLDGLDRCTSDGGQEQLDIRVDGSIMADGVGLDPQAFVREMLRLIDHLMQLKANGLTHVPHPLL